MDANPFEPFDAVVAGLRSYGDVHEVAGFARLDGAARAALEQRLVDRGLAAGFAVAGTLKDGWMDFIGDRGSGWPDVRLQSAAEGRLAMCVLARTSGPPRHALHDVVRALESGGGLRVQPVDGSSG